MPNLKINDIEVNVEPGTLLLDACAQAGFTFPHYCYHPTLSPVATCRMCMVEIKGQPKLATSCTTTGHGGPGGLHQLQGRWPTPGPGSWNSCS